MTTKVESAEGAAKAALLNHLRAARSLRGRVLISELALDKWARRADVVTVGKEMVAYEIKTHADRLSRLDAQMMAYSAVFDRVHVAVASKHINAAISRVPPFVGIMELTRFGGELQVRPVKDALLSPEVSRTATLQLLPVAELTKLVRAQLGRAVPGGGRSRLLHQISELPLGVIRGHLRGFLREKHASSTGAFLASTANRKIASSDLAQLSIWGRTAEPKPVDYDREAALADWLSRLSETRAFGPIPADVETLFSASV